MTTQAWTTPVVATDTVQPVISEEDGAFLPTFLLYPWISPLISRCEDASAEGRTIRPEELLTLPEDEEVHRVYHEVFMPAWKHEIETPVDPRKGPSLAGTLRRCFGKTVLFGLCMKVLSDATTVCIPLVLRAQVKWIANFAVDPEAYKDRMWEGYILSLVMGVMTIFMSINQNASAFYCSKAFSKMRTCVMLALFDKATTLPGSHTVGGRVTQMHGTDASKFVETSIFFLNLFTAVPMLIGAIIALYFFIGPAAFIGLAVSILTVPPQLVSARGIGMERALAAKQGDKRVNKVNEFVQGIRIIKFMSWEDQFEKTTEHARQKEVDHFVAMQKYRSVFSSISTIGPVFITFITFACAYWFGFDMNAADVFAGFAMLNVIRMPLAIIPFVGAKVAELNVIVGRMQEFLIEPEHADQVHMLPDGIPDAKDAAIFIPHAVIQYDASKVNATTPSTAGVPPAKPAFDAKPSDPAAPVEERKTELQTLMSIDNFAIPKQQLTIVIGATAAGKSVLISTIVGETQLTPDSAVYRSGTVAYVAQEAWIMNATLKDNILMGRSYDEQKYKEAVLSCQLKSDFEQLPGSDATEIGERGLNLSGGQKQRVAFARAVYSDRDIVLMDDPLSAVDPHVCGALFHGCIRGALAGKTRVLVTHQQQFLQWADRVVLVAGLNIIFNGTYAELLTRPDLQQYMASAKHASTAEKTQEAEDTLLKDLAKADAVAHADFAGLARAYTVPPPQESKVEAGAQQGTVLMSTEKVQKSDGIFIFAWYLRQGTWTQFFLMLFLFCAWRAALGISDYFLTWWASRAQPFDRYNFTQDMYLYWWFILIVITTIFTFLRMVPFVTSVINACRNVHGVMIHRLLHAPTSYFDTTPAGRILSRTGKDMEVIDIVIPETLSIFYNIFLNVLGAWVVQAVAAWYMPLVYLFVLILFFFLFKGYVAANHDVKFLDAVLRSPCMNIMNETLGGLATLRAYGMIGNYREQHAMRVHRMNRSTYCWRNLQRWLGVRTDFLSAFMITAIGMITIATLSGMSRADRLSNLPSISLALTYVIVTTPAIGFITNFLAELVAAFSSVERVKEYMETLPQERALTYADGPVVLVNEVAVEAPAPPADWPEHGSLQFDQVYLRYREGLDLVLKDVSFNVEAGEKVGVVGRTGSGKSTVMLSLFRMIETAKGEGGASRILIDGIDISHVKLHDLRTKVTIIPQDPLLFQGTVRSNLDPFNSHTDDEIWAVLEKAKLRERVEKDDEKLDCLVADRGANFSAGERQLLCLARALLKNCKILLLDEATASIDPHHDQIVQDTIRREFADRTVLTIAHRLGTIIDSDKVLVLDAGRVLEYGSPHELLQKADGQFRSMVHELGPEEEHRLHDVAATAASKRKFPY